MQIRSNHSYFLVKIILVCIIPVLSGNVLFCQFFEYGQDPASIKWNQINTDNFKIIYPHDFNDNAIKISFLLEENYKNNASQLQYKPRKIPVVIHNQTVIANGFVGIAPRRMELFTYPDPKQYSGDWLNQLTIHEQRHVTQIDKVNQGFTRFLSFLTGEQGQGYGAALLPFWLLEGDAVFAETSLTQTGRGRLPSFEKDLKAILADNPKGYSHEKSFLGSYKDFVPDYYRYGYQMVNFTQKKYGEDFWSDAVKYTGRNSWMLFPLSYYLKKETGINRTTLHNETMTYLKDHWEEKAKKRNVISYNLLNKPSKVYSNYTYPHLQKDSAIIALKTGLDIIPCFFKIDKNGNENCLFIPGILNSGRFSIYENRILWDEFTPDLRWSNRNYSIIREYNFETKMVRSLTFDTYYSSPVYSPEGDIIATIESTPQLECFLVLISALDGKIIHRIPGPVNTCLQSPEWIKGTNYIAAIANTEKGKSIVLFDQDKTIWKNVFYAGYYDIHDLESIGDYLLFQGSFNGIDDIYALNYINSKIFRITFSAFGAFTPTISPDEKEILFSLYSKNGNKISKINYNPIDFQYVNIDSLHTEEQSFFNNKYIHESDLATLNVPDNYVPEIKSYSRISSLFRFHSWAPLYIDYSNPSLENSGINPGLSLTSQNILSTAFTSLGYEFTNNEHYLHASFTYKGFLPVIKFSFDYGGNPGIFKRDTIPSPSEVSKYLFFNLLSYIPFNLSSGKMINGIQPIIKYSYSGNYFYYKSEQSFIKGIHYLEPRIYIYSYLRMAHRDIQPKWGIILDGKLLSAPFEEEQVGSISSFNSTIYLPGIIKNQGFKVQIHMQNQNTKTYLFNNQITFPRGYKDLTAIKLMKYSVDYTAPLLYPDIKIGSLIYLKRIYASIYTDFMKGIDIYETINNKRVISDKNLYSLGSEIYFEYHLFRFLFPFIQGIRISYISERQKYIYENLFSINLSRF